MQWLKHPPTLYCSKYHGKYKQTHTHNHPANTFCRTKKKSEPPYHLLLGERRERGKHTLIAADQVYYFEIPNIRLTENSKILQFPFVPIGLVSGGGDNGWVLINKLKVLRRNIFFLLASVSSVFRIISVSGGGIFTIISHSRTDWSRPNANDEYYIAAKMSSRTRFWWTQNKCTDRLMVLVAVTAAVVNQRLIDERAAASWAQALFSRNYRYTHALI